ncbi:cytochrome-c oxidase, cbb3-type subunit III [Albidovulum sp.]|uniref:cytochrome-c oxidase, cbb3-type subunit III n=1 Tax=Albidovulum sp. TaxID=1872424 RepID=UPI0039B912F7
MSPSGGHEREVDPVTGYDTTGHDWNGIRELNTPFPKIVLVFLLATVLYSVVAWILLPAWPTGRDHTRGLLGLDQGQVAVKGFAALDGRRQGWLARFDQPDFAALAADPVLMAAAMPAAARLFGDNCAACHGTGGRGGPGFPVLADRYWLWGGDPETVAETIRVGINSTDADTRYAEMPSFAGLPREDRATLARHVAGLPSGVAEKDGPAAALFADNCAACHGDAGDGGLMNGAPSLTDAATIYGQDEATVAQTLKTGRKGEMPSWAPRLSAAEINLLALYVTRLGGGEDGQ